MPHLDIKNHVALGMLAVEVDIRGHDGSHRDAAKYAPAQWNCHLSFFSGANQKATLSGVLKQKWLYFNGGILTDGLQKSGLFWVLHYSSLAIHAIPPEVSIRIVIEIGRCHRVVLSHLYTTLSELGPTYFPGPR